MYCRLAYLHFLRGRYQAALDAVEDIRRFDGRLLHFIPFLVANGNYCVQLRLRLDGEKWLHINSSKIYLLVACNVHLVLQKT